MKSNIAWNVKMSHSTVHSPLIQRHVPIGAFLARAHQVIGPQLWSRRARITTISITSYKFLIELFLHKMFETFRLRLLCGLKHAVILFDVTQNKTETFRIRLYLLK